MERLKITQGLRLKPEQLALIRRAIERKKRTEMEVADAIGFKRSTMSQTLNGDRPISETKLRELCAEVGLRVIARLEVDVYV